MDQFDCICFSNPKWYRAKELDDYHFLYSYRSGDTHVLNFFSYGLLSVLSEQKMAFPEMKKAVCQKLLLEEADVQDALLAHTLDELTDIGLVECQAAADQSYVTKGTGNE